MSTKVKETKVWYLNQEFFNSVQAGGVKYDWAAHEPIVFSDAAKALFEAVKEARYHIWKHRDSSINARREAFSHALYDIIGSVEQKYFLASHTSLEAEGRLRFNGHVNKIKKEIGLLNFEEPISISSSMFLKRCIEEHKSKVASDLSQIYSPLTCD